MVCGTERRGESCQTMSIEYVCSWEQGLTGTEREPREGTSKAVACGAARAARPEGIDAKDVRCDATCETTHDGRDARPPPRTPGPQNQKSCP